MKCPKQPPGTNVCGFYVMENMRIIVNERRNNLRALRLHDIREDLLPNDRLQAIQEELAGFFDEGSHRSKGTIPLSDIDGLNV